MDFISAFFCNSLIFRFGLWISFLEVFGLLINFLIYVCVYHHLSSLIILLLGLVCWWCFLPIFFLISFTYSFISRIYILFFPSVSISLLIFSFMFQYSSFKLLIILSMLATFLSRTWIDFLIHIFKSITWCWLFLEVGV